MFLQAWFCEGLQHGSDASISLGDHETEAGWDVRAELTVAQTLHKVIDKHCIKEKLMADFIKSLLLSCEDSRRICSRVVWLSARSRWKPWSCRTSS